MQSITIKNIPDDIHNSLKNMAKVNHRSLNNEIIHCLERYAKTGKTDVESLMERARATRMKIKHTFTDAEIERAKNEGRK